MKEAQYIQLTPESNNLDGFPWLSKYVSPIRAAKDKVLHEIIYEVLNRPYDHIDISNFMIEVGFNDAWKIFYKNIEIGTIKSKITDDNKLIVEFCPVATQ